LPLKITKTVFRLFQVFLNFWRQKFKNEKTKLKQNWNKIETKLFSSGNWILYVKWQDQFCLQSSFNWRPECKLKNIFYFLGEQNMRNEKLIVIPQRQIHYVVSKLSKSPWFHKIHQEHEQTTKGMSIKMIQIPFGQTLLFFLSMSHFKIP
jgi:hypothetical protein